eukprot:gene32445-40044_t
MLVGLLMGNAVSYPLWDYIEAILLTAGVTSFTLTQKASKSSQSDSWYGVGLLACYLLGDSFTSQFQSSVGQLFLYYTLQEYGAVTLTIIMTVRQVVSLFVSCLLFGHPLDAIAM